MEKIAPPTKIITAAIRAQMKLFVIHASMLADRQARAARHRFVLVAGTAPIVSAALRVSGVIDCLECAGSVEEALSAS